MARPCKVCSSTLRAEIDRQILDGVSFYNLEKYCTDRGLRISAVSINRHAKSHVKGYEDRSNGSFNYEPTNTPRNQTAIETSLNPLIIESVDSSDLDVLISTFKTNMMRSIANCSSVVDNKLLAYMNGEAKAPSDEIRMLKNLVEILDICTGKERHKRAGQHIFDLERSFKQDDTSLDAEIDQLFKNLN